MLIAYRIATKALVVLTLTHITFLHNDVHYALLLHYYFGGKHL